MPTTIEEMAITLLMVGSVGKAIYKLRVTICSGLGEQQKQGGQAGISRGRQPKCRGCDRGRPYGTINRGARSECRNFTLLLAS